MAIYVDELRDYRALMGIGIPGFWCHLVTDGDLEELHQFAARMGVHRRHFQDHPHHPHYDLHPYARELAIALGAVEVTTAHLARIFHQNPLS